MSSIQIKVPSKYSQSSKANNFNVDVPAVKLRSDVKFDVELSFAKTKFAKRPVKQKFKESAKVRKTGSEAGHACMHQSCVME